MPSDKISFEAELLNAKAIQGFKELEEAAKKVKVDAKKAGLGDLVTEFDVATKRIVKDTKEIETALNKATTPDSIRKWATNAMQAYNRGQEQTTIMNGEKSYGLTESLRRLKALNTAGKDLNNVYGILKSLISNTDQLKVSFDSYNKEQEKATQGARDFAMQESTATDATKEFLRALHQVGGLSGIDFGADTAKMGIVELLRYMSSLKERIEQLRNAGVTGRGTSLLDNELNNAQDALRRTQEQVDSFVSHTRTAMNLASQGMKVLERGIQNVINFFKKLGSIAVSAAKKIYSVFKSVGKNIQSFFSGIYKGLAKDADRAFSTKNLKRTLQMLTKYIFGVRSFFFLYRKLRSGIAEGLKNLVQFESESNATNHAITELRTSLLFLKNAWAAAFAPIINAVYPILVSFMNLLASVGNAIARFMAALTGQSTVLQALRVDAGDYADSLKDAAGGAGKAAKAQEELNDRLAAFDDLNVLGVDEDKTPSGSGGGGGGADDLLDPNSMFERINTPYNKLIEMIRDAWKSGDAFELGELFATRLKESLDHAYEWLTGEGRDLVMKIGHLIGTFLDGALSVDSLGESFGRTIGAAIVLALDFIDEIVTPDRMVKIGEQIASALNAAIPMVVPKLGETLGNLFRSAIARAWGFLTKADFASWGESIAEGFNNFLEQMSEEVVITRGKGTLQFDAKVERTGLNGWQMLGQDVTLIAQGMIDMLGKVIGEADWKELGKGIGQLIENIDISSLKESLSKLWEKIKEALKELWEGYREGNPEGASGIESMFKGAVDLLPDLLALAAVIASIAGGISLISGAMSVAFPLISTLLPFITAGTLATELAAIAGALSPIAIAVVLIGGAIVGAVEALASFRAGLDDGAEGAVGLYGHLQMLFGGAFPTLVYWISYAAGRFDSMIEDIENGSVKLKNIGDTISYNVSMLFLFVRGLWLAFKDTIIRGVELIKSNFESFGTFVVQLFSGDIRGALNTCISAIETFLNSCIQGLTELANNPAIGGIAGLAGRSIATVTATTITLPRIPALAQGAVIPPNNQFLAVLGDQRSGTNIEAPLDTIKQAVGEEFAPYAEAIVDAVMQVVSAVNNKELKIGDKEIGRANDRYNTQRSIIRGTML